MTRLLVCADYFTPAIAAGGPPVALAAIIGATEHRVSLACRDRDLGAAEPFGPSAQGQVDMGRHRINYVSLKAPLDLVTLSRWMRLQHPDVIYLNSFFSKPFTLLPLLLRLLGILGEVPVILSPRGEFHPNAMRLGSGFKRAYIAGWKLLKLHRYVNWCASSPTEADQIATLWGREATIHLVPETPRFRALEEPRARRSLGGELKLIFVGRVAPVKGLLAAINAANAVSAAIDFSIYGPIEDKNYWKECQHAIEQSPSHVRIHYLGLADGQTVMNALSHADALVQPTATENFGHSIAEALSMACPVLIGPNTPWSKSVAQSRAGWVIDPCQTDSIAGALTQLARMPEEERHSQRQAALDAYRSWHSGISPSAFDDVIDAVLREA